VPLGVFNVITAVSGSGKSARCRDPVQESPGSLEMRHRSARDLQLPRFTGSENVGRAILIDQSPIGRTPRSNPVTYTGAGRISATCCAASPRPEPALGTGRFSFNRAGGRCEACEGNGEMPFEMHFLPTVYGPATSATASAS